MKNDPPILDISNIDLEQEIHQDIVNYLAGILPESIDAEKLIKLWFITDKTQDQALKNLISDHSRYLLEDFESIEELIELWFKTPSKQLRLLICNRLKELCQYKPVIIKKLSTIFYSS